ncbi:MAG: hypothetical protein HY788_06930 [Deltaproteobacteria bacterium]|nr:hypothetical protein [Deltaproteobacteria bacterium]
MAKGFFTLGVKFELPHPPIPQRTLLLLCKVIRKAWQLLRETPIEGFSLQSAHEDAITLHLVWILENRLRKNGEVDGFNCELFGRVVREPTITNYDNEHPDKMPDIVFGLRREKRPILSEEDGLFVECKPIDSKHSIFSCYCKKGLIRFVNGDYAWAMQDALMVGYVKGGYSYDKLASVLDDIERSREMNTTNHSLLKQREIYCSNHSRDFQWLESHGKACPIAVSHLWLCVEAPVELSRKPRVLRA